MGKDARIGQKIDFLGYLFTHDVTLMRKRIKKTFARKVMRIKGMQRRQEVLASYWGWCKWGDCRHLWNILTDNDMSFAERGIKGQTTTKDGKRFFDDPEKKMMEILNFPIEIVDFEPGVKTRNGDNRYAVRFRMEENGETRYFKVITNSFSLKSVLDQARVHDQRLCELKEMRSRGDGDGNGLLPLSELNITDRERAMLLDGRPVLPQRTSIHRKDLGGGKYDFYFE